MLLSLGSEWTVGFLLGWKVFYWREVLAGDTKFCRAVDDFACLESSCMHQNLYQEKKNKTVTESKIIDIVLVVL